MTAAETVPRYTGERPCWGQTLFGYDEARALAPYAHVLELVSEERVLDAGCGEGFGTRSLATRAAHVLGVDYSESAISYCQQRWGGDPKLEFRVLDFASDDALNERFDVVVNFQMIEHIEDDLRFLQRLRGSLAEVGTLVVVTPNRLTSFSENPYHVREYTPEEFEARLRQVFRSVEILGVHGSERVLEFDARRRRLVQRILRFDVLGARRWLPRSITTTAFARFAVLVRKRLARGTAQPEFELEDFPIRAGDCRASLDLLAVCRG